jgi:hypothetical protein
LSFILIIILNQVNIQKNKIDKDNFGKNHKKKIMWENTAAIHSVLRKKNYKAKFSINLILKNKIDRDNFRKKNITKKKQGKKTLLGTL